MWEIPELADDEYYEMWYYIEDGSRISCGTFQVGSKGRTTVNLTAPATARDYPEIEITREPDDGAPGRAVRRFWKGSFRALELAASGYFALLTELHNWLRYIRQLIQNFFIMQG